MKSFREFLIEGWQSKKVDNTHFYQHDDNVNNKEVSVNFYHDKNKNYEVGFLHSGELDNFNDDPVHGKKVYQHVHSKIKQFIRGRRPKSLTFAANDEKTDEMYKKFGRKLAKKFKGNFYPDHDGVTHKVVFRENKETDLTFGDRLKHHATIKTNFPDADFWIVRKGTPDKVGSVTHEYSPEHIGVQNRNHNILPDYLKYSLMHVHKSGYYRGLHKGVINLQHITTKHIEAIPLDTGKSSVLHNHKLGKSLNESEDDEWEPHHTYSGYHGTPDARGIHKEGFRTLRQRHGIQNDQLAKFYGTSDYKTAKSYANPHRAMDYQNSEPAVLPVEFHMKNPKVIHWGGNKYHYKDEYENWHHIDHHIEQARKDGHDGFIIHRVIDNYNASGKPSTVMGVFDHRNIRVKK